ncbi:MAG: hypothetical protein R3C26_05790 [Calditrichia bacterium]
MELSDDAGDAIIQSRRLARLIKIFAQNSLEALNEREKPANSLPDYIE